MKKQMENAGYHGPFRDPSALRMFDARNAVMRLLAEQIYQLNIPGDVAELGVFRAGVFCPDPVQPSLIAGFIFLIRLRDFRKGCGN